MGRAHMEIIIKLLRGDFVRHTIWHGFAKIIIDLVIGLFIAEISRRDEDDEDGEQGWSKF